MPYNHLKNEKSPYLLQHAQNPVDWYPWGEEAFNKAKLEDKPVFLSIGYSACHWCHVMEHESFEDERVAHLLNETFINIKVDREERPDIDSIYMKICQMMTQSGGWPLTIFMTPDKKPFFAATYIPRETNYGRTGLIELIPKIRSIWSKNRHEINNTAEEIVNALIKSQPESTGNIPDKVILRKAYEIFNRSYDHQYGGFGQAPKFPSPHNFFFLLRYWKRTGEKLALQMAEKTLQNMYMGGIYDQIGFGFHRYSTDEKWHVPHFEKMLYDQALMAMAYIEAFQATGKPTYKKAVREIFTYVLRDMTDPEGGFYSAEDADSEGIEGRFYLWTQEEIKSILKKDETDLFLSLYNNDEISSHGLHGIKPGHFIPRLQKQNFSETADDQKEIEQMPDEIREKLFMIREKRIHPRKDDKILADWNGLMIAALAKGAQALNEPLYAQEAGRAMGFILNRMRDSNGNLLHRFRDGLASLPATVDDYAFVIWGLLELYETEFDAGRLNTAFELNNDLLKNFWDDRNGGLFFTQRNAEKLLMRQKEIYDGAIPSGNSVSLLNFTRLGKITGDASLENKAAEILKLFAGQINQNPSAFSQLLSGLDFIYGPSSEVVIAGELTQKDTQEMLLALRKNFIPSKVVIFNPDNMQSDGIIKTAPFLKYNKSINSKATAYVCSNYTCELPTNNPEQMLALLNSKGGRI